MLYQLTIDVYCQLVLGLLMKCHTHRSTETRSFVHESGLRCLWHTHVNIYEVILEQYTLRCHLIQYMLYIWERCDKYRNSCIYRHHMQPIWETHMY